jgi:MFS family permease
LAVISMALYTYTTYHPLLAILIPAALFNAFGRSMWFPSLNSLISHSAGRETQGISFGVFHAMMSLARVIGPLIAGAVFATHVSGPFVLAGVILLGVGVWMASLHRRRGRMPVADIAPVVAENVA